MELPLGLSGSKAITSIQRLVASNRDRDSLMPMQPSLVGGVQVRKCGSRLGADSFVTCTI